MIRELITASTILTFAGIAQAVPVTPQEVSDTLAAHGVADLSITPTEGSSSSKVNGAIDGVNFIADVRDCADDGTGCKTVLLFANFSLDREAISEDYVKANSYNDRRTWGRAYVLGNEIGVDYAVDLYDENVFGENEVSTWKIILNAFKEHHTEAPKEK